MKGNNPLEDHRYTAADLSKEQLERIVSLEQELQRTTQKEIVLIAYEEHENGEKFHAD
jgi:hypothetical protein